MRFLLFILAISGCKTTNPVVSEPEFMTYLQDDPHTWSLAEKDGTIKRLLVSKVYEKSWDIDYGFAPTCSKRQRNKIRPKIIEAIHRAVNLWLDPIRTIKQKPPLKLITKLNIREKKKLFPGLMGEQKLYWTFDYGNIVNKLIEKDSKGVELLLNLPELSVVFNCNEGRAWMQHRFNSINVYEPTKSKSTNINATKIPKTKFSFVELLHEVGHTFGLADTYVDAKDSFRDHMVSTDINPYTVGHQPLSIMSAYQFLDFTNYDQVTPTKDDKNGIFWLYVHMHINKLKLDTCPYQYQPEFFARDDKNKPPTVACRPKHPFLFAMASENYSTARILLYNGAPIDINARTHKKGPTALHYAVTLAPIKFTENILERFHQEIDFTIAGSIFKLPSMTAMELAKFLLELAQKENDKTLVKAYSAVIKLLSKYIN